MAKRAQYKIVIDSTGQQVLGYASRAHADAWLAKNEEFYVFSLRRDSLDEELFSVHGEMNGRPQ